MNDLPSTSRFSFSDLLRVRRKLSAREVIHLLDGAARAESGQFADVSLNSLYVEVSTTGGNVDWRTSDITTWPSLRVGIIHAEIADTDFERTRIPRARADISVSPVSRFSAVVYELLGGRSKAFESVRAPLAALNEEANRILQEAMRARASDVRLFWQSWTDACGYGSSQETWRIPKWVSREGEEYGVLDLVSSSNSVPSIRLSARSQFRLGRSGSMSDFVARLLESDADGAEISARISRIHVLAELTKRGISLRDGDGTKATLNGSTFDGTPLSSLDPRFITAGGLLNLASSYELELLLAHGPSIARDWQIENTGRIWPDGCVGDFSSLRFRPVRGDFVRDAVWVFSMIGFTVKSSGKIDWNNHESDGYFIRNRGRFWIANAQLDSSRIRIDDAGIGRRQIVPLCHGQSLELGECRFTVTTESPEERP